MLLYILRRLLSGVTVLVVLACATFTLLYFSSTNIARNLLGELATAEQVAAKEQELGLDRPLIVRLFEWLGSAIHGDLGVSWFTSQPVTQALATRLPVTLTVIAVSTVGLALFAISFGILSAVKRGWVDRVLQVVAVTMQAIPDFIIALVFVVFFAVTLGWLPATSTISPGSGVDAWVTSLVLPVVALVVNGFAGTAQQFRSAVITEFEKDYVRTLRSRGTPEMIILFKHVLRNAAPAGLTVLSLRLIGMLGGVVIIEKIFALPGMGNLAVQSTITGDIPIVMGVVIYTGLIVIGVNLLVDLANAALNPKVRVS